MARFRLISPTASRTPSSTATPSPSSPARASTAEGPEPVEWGTFTGLPNNSRITFPNELGSVKITYTATTVTLSDWQPTIRELTWDPGTADAGTQVLSNTSTRAGRHYFHINTQATDIGAWRTRLTVATGEADLYLSLTTIPQSTSGIAANRKSERTGSDGLVLRSDEFAAGQDWYLLVNATAGAQWSLFSGRAWVRVHAEG